MAPKFNDDSLVNYEEDFVCRLFRRWDTQLQGQLSLGDIVHGIDRLVEDDLMTSIANFFELYDDDGTGRLDRNIILRMSEGLLFLTRPWRQGPAIFDEISVKRLEASRERYNQWEQQLQQHQQQQDESGIDAKFKELPPPPVVDIEMVRQEQSARYLSAVSNFIQRAFEYSTIMDESAKEDSSSNRDDALSSHDSPKHEDSNQANDPKRPIFINLATFRMVILADETLELFFTSSLRNTVRLDEAGTGYLDMSLSKRPSAAATLRSVFDGIISDGMRVAGEVRRRIDELDKQPKPQDEEEEEADNLAVKQADRDLLDDS
jgi:hypothetical protein